MVSPSRDSLVSRRCTHPFDCADTQLANRDHLQSVLFSDLSNVSLSIAIPRHLRKENARKKYLLWPIIVHDTDHLDSFYIENLSMFSHQHQYKSTHPLLSLVNITTESQRTCLYWCRIRGYVRSTVAEGPTSLYLCSVPYLVVYILCISWSYQLTPLTILTLHYGT
jgi:hypothetical protein